MNRILGKGRTWDFGVCGDLGLRWISLGALKCLDPPGREKKRKKKNGEEEGGGRRGVTGEGEDVIYRKCLAEGWSFRRGLSPKLESCKHIMKYCDILTGH